MMNQTDIPAALYHAENQYMEIAIQEAREGIHLGHGGPFGSVIRSPFTV